jgi:type IV/VI secretion system ImpK/VasF family protein
MNNALLTLEKTKSSIILHPMAAFTHLHGLNPLVSAALPLLLLMIKFKQAYGRPQQINELRGQLIAETNAFVERAKILQCAPRHILAARYCLCTALDETILATSWGNQSDWAQQTLLSIVQKETWGGERFFVILEEMVKLPQENLSILELIYLILSFGFEGKYYTQTQALRDEIRNRLFYMISAYREEPIKNLSPSIKIELQPKKAVLNPYSSPGKVAGITFALLLGLGVIFNIATYLSGRNILRQLAEINQSASIITTPDISKNTKTPINAVLPVQHHLRRHKSRHHLSLPPYSYELYETLP